MKWSPLAEETQLIATEGPGKDSATGRRECTYSTTLQLLTNPMGVHEVRKALVRPSQRSVAESFLPGDSWEALWQYGAASSVEGFLLGHR